MRDATTRLAFVQQILRWPVLFADHRSRPPTRQAAALPNLRKLLPGHCVQEQVEHNGLGPIPYNASIEYASRPMFVHFPIVCFLAGLGQTLISALVSRRIQYVDRACFLL